MTFMYAFLAAVFFGVVVYIVLYIMLQRIFGLAPVRLDRKYQDNPLAVKRLINTANRILPQSLSDADTLRARIARAGLNISATIYHGLTVLFWVVIISAALLIATIRPTLENEVVIALVAVLVCFAVPRIYLYQRARARADRIRATLPKALDILSISVEAGLTPDRAIRLYAQNNKNKSPLVHEFSLVDLETNAMGYSRAQALQRMADRCRVDDLSLFVGALNSSVAAGSPIAEVLRNQSEAAFERRRQSIEEMGNKLDAKMVVPLGLLMLPATILAVAAPFLINIIANASKAFL